MLEITAKKQKKKSRFPLTFILIILVVTLILLFYWDDLQIDFVGKEDSNTQGIYIEPFTDLSFRVSEFLQKYDDFELKNIENADLIISKNPEVTLLNDSELLFQKVAVPIGKFGETKRSLSSDEVSDIVLYETGIASYFVNDESEIVEMSCAEVKEYVNEKNSRAIVSLECMDKLVSAFGVDGVSVFGNIQTDYQLTREDGYFDNYALTYEIWASYNDKWVLKEQLDYIKESFPLSTFDEENIGQVIMTGVTAMGRTVLQKIEAKGSTYPIEKVASVTRYADVAHTSNEVSFVENCVQEPHTLSFCAPMEAIETLTYGGFDIIELTGNHNNDKGSNWNRVSMEMYEENDIEYVGGGKNIVDANTVKYTDIGEYTIGWVGFNAPGPSYAWATESSSGAAEYFEDKLIKNVTEANANADSVIVVIQWQNENYSYPTDFQSESARLAIDNGADIVVGSQGHGTQKMEFYNDGAIYYGLGNFMFDQMFSDKVRQGVILRLNTVNGEVRNMEMLPYVIEDFCQPNFIDGIIGESIVNEIVAW